MAVETALVAMLLITMLFGIIETSFLYRDGLVISAASRAGARTASSLPREATYATSAKSQITSTLGSMDLSRVSAVWVFKANPSTGLPDSGSFASCTTCVKYVGTPAGLIPNGPANWDPSAQKACAGDVDTLGVYVRYNYPSRLGFFFPNHQVSESTVMRLEPYAKAGACKP